MIVDTSALIAILRDEPDGERLLRALARADRRAMSAASYLETGIIVDVDRDPILSRRLDEFLSEIDVEVVSVTPQQARIAREAYRDYGKGSGHPARLNFGDCFAYALAKDAREPLLYIGDDFVHTDLEPALT
jgi:ribonuclease VapC